MYAALWRVLPGPGGCGSSSCCCSSPRSSLALFTWVFPLVDQFVSPIGSRRWTNDPHPRHRQLRQLRLHAERLPLAARRRDRGACATTHSRAEDAAARIAEYDAVLLSPGPGHAADAGVSIPIVRGGARGGPAAARRLPRSPGDRRGARRDGDPRRRAHARQDVAASRHDDSAFYDGVPQPFTRDAVPLARRRRRHGARPSSWSRPHAGRRDHGPATPRRRRSIGVQFHPESVLTEGGYRMLGNWLAVDRAPRGARARGARSARCVHTPELIAPSATGQPAQ